MSNNVKSFCFYILIFTFFITYPYLLSGDTRTVLFFGDSVTAGYGLDPLEAYPARIQEKINSSGLNFKAVNGGLSGETSAGGLRRINWMLKRPIHILVLALGSNDGLRGLNTSVTKENLQAIIEITKYNYPRAKIMIAGLKAPPNMGSEYTEYFETIFTELAEVNKAVFIPFLLEGVAGVATLNQADGIHPNVEGHHILAENVWKYLKPLLVENNVSLNNID
jgi:acyl-CoA thioesterase-1